MSDPLEEDVAPVDEIASAIESGYRPGRWWRAVDSEGTLLAETSNPSEFRYLGLTDRDDVFFYQMYTRVDEEWVKVSVSDVRHPSQK